MGLQIKNIIRWLNLDIQIPDAKITGVSIDTRTLRPGNLFVALQGENSDGHDYVVQALEKGACAALVSRTYAAAHSDSLRLIPVNNPLIALQHIAFSYRQQFKGYVIAITGSNGKTTTKEMVAQLLSRKYRIHKTEGNLNNHIGVPLTILHCPNNADMMVIEMGMNHPGEIKALCAIAKPTHGIITNVGRGHLGFFKSIAAIGRAKAELLDALKESGVAFINGDDPCLVKYRHVAARTVLFGFGKNNQIHAEKMQNPLGQPAMIVDSTEVRLNIPGSHQLYNALAAIAIGRELKISLSDMVQALSLFHSCKQRMEKIEIKEIQILNDAYNANPDSVLAALDTLSEIPAKRHIAILGDMLELGEFSEDEHVFIAKAIKKRKIDVFWGVGPQMKHTFKQLLSNGSFKCIHFNDTKKLMVQLSDQFKPGDAVLIKGSRGMHMENVVDAIINQIKSKDRQY